LKKIGKKTQNLEKFVNFIFKIENFQKFSIFLSLEGGENSPK
jgi:hypothetical protein